MALYVATTALTAPDNTAALKALAALGAEGAWLVPGLEAGLHLEKSAQAFNGRLALHHTCLEEPGGIPWNLAAKDEAVRRVAVGGAKEAMRRAAEWGAAYYSIQAGFAYEGVPESGAPPQSRKRARDQLCRSLDTLAATADGHHLKLLVLNEPGGAKSEQLFTEPEEIVRIFERVAAPPLGLLFDVGHWIIACHARKWEPEPPLMELLPLVRAIALHRNDAVKDTHLPPKEGGFELELAKLAGGLALPVFLAPRGVSRDVLEDAMALTHYALAAQPQVR